jgi:restriction endonuclease
MKIKFDPNLAFQKQAIDAITGVFEGQEICRTISGNCMKMSALIILSMIPANCRMSEILPPARISRSW